MLLEYWMQEIRLEDRESDCEVGVCAADRCAKIKAFSCQAHARLQPTARSEGGTLPASQWSLTLA